MASVLSLNAGSSSLKASIIGAGRRMPLAAATVEWGSDATRLEGRRQTVADALARMHTTDFDAVGHRVVHGGVRFRAPTLIDDDILAELDEVSALAPLHNPVAVDTIRAARELLADLPHVAVFDTAFHATLPESAYIYPLPWSWHAEWAVRRFGFHGLAVAWAVRRAGEMLGRDPAGLGIVVAHLGSGCSVSAVDGGRSVATSMGMTPLEGLMMGTRAGSFDPGIALQLLRDGRLSLREMAEALEHGSGLLGVSGVSGDMRQVVAAAEAGSERAALAIDMFSRRAAEGIAAAATSLSRLDALVFSGGIGEHAGGIRARIVGRLATVGVDEIADQSVEEDAVLSAPGSRVAVLRVEAREDVLISEAVRSILPSERT